MIKKSLLRTAWHVCVFCLVCFGTLLASSCMDSDDVGDAYKTIVGQTAAEYLQAEPELTMFAEALQSDSLLSTLASYGKYTIFAPTNDAINEFIVEKGYSSFEELKADKEKLDEMLRYHIIDGEANSANAYFSTSFKDKEEIATKNMENRYIYTSISEDGASWSVSGANIIKRDQSVINGVIHTVDKVVQGSNATLAGFIASNANFTIYAEALKATGITDSLTKTQDDTYKYVKGMNYPEQKLIGFTALLEPDSVLALNGITDIASMREKAKILYPNATATDDKDKNSALWQFVAYHILPYKTTAKWLCPTKAFTVTKTWESEDWQKVNFRDGKFYLENFLFPMLDNSLIYVQKFVWRDTEDMTPVFNCQENPYDPQYTRFLDEVPGVITIDQKNSNLDCLNGQIHSLTNLLYYSEDDATTMLGNHRIRMDFTCFIPELFSNDIVPNQQQKVLPHGYCSNITWDNSENIPSMNYYLEYGGHSQYWGNVLELNGRCNCDMVVGPIPAGKYEVRVGYRVRFPSNTSNTNYYGMVQYYFDGDPCGIPLNAGVDQYNNGWLQTQCYYQDVDGYEQNHVTSWDKNGTTGEEDYYGYQNDKMLYNQGYMKGPDSFTSDELSNSKDYTNPHAGSARNDPYTLRKVLKTVTFTTMSKHTMRISNLQDLSFSLDYIEFIPVSLIKDEDTH